MTLSATVTTQRMLGSSVGQPASMELYDWQLETSMNSIKTQSHWRTVISSRMNWPGAELRCVLEGTMVQSVMTTGALRMHLLSALNWDFHQMVYAIISIANVYQLMALLSKGAIFTTGGIFSDATVSVVIGRVECSGNESEVLQCSHVSINHEAVTDCDPNQVGGIICQGMCIPIVNINPYLLSHSKILPLNFLSVPRERLHS